MSVIRGNTVGTPINPKKILSNGVVFNDLDHNEAGNLAAAFGEETKALGKGSFAAGSKNTRSGGNANNPSDLLYTEAVGTGSMASGMGAIAFARASKSFGYRTQTGYPPDASWIEKRKGVTVKTDADGNNIFPSDNEGQGAVAMGADTAAVANHSFAGGQQSKTFGLNSFAYGTEAVTRFKNAVAMGSHTEADEECSTAFGAYSKAKGKWSLAVGEHAEAMGNCSAAIGHGTVTATGSPGYSQMVVGRYNAYKNGECDNKLFVVGNGSNEDSRSNAFTVDRYGNTEVKGKLSFGSLDDASLQKIVSAVLAAMSN